MEHEISFMHKEQIYTSVYSVEGDDLTVYLPDSTHRTTTLRGLDPELAAMTHLRAFALHSAAQSLL